jgi:hypothetical protein
MRVRRYQLEGWRSQQYKQFRAAIGRRPVFSSIRVASLAGFKKLEMGKSSFLNQPREPDQENGSNDRHQNAGDDAA